MYILFGVVEYLHQEGNNKTNKEKQTNNKPKPKQKQNWRRNKLNLFIDKQGENVINKSNHAFSRNAWLCVLVLFCGLLYCNCNGKLWNSYIVLFCCNKIVLTTLQTCSFLFITLLHLEYCFDYLKCYTETKQE